MTSPDTGTGDRAMLRFRILGPVQVWDGEHPVPIAGPRQVALLAFLLVRANQAVSTDELLDVIWHDVQRDGGAKRVHVAIARLRKDLARAGAPDRLRTVLHGYQLVTRADELDAERFAVSLTAAGAAAASGAHADALRRIDDALELWRGPPLADVGYEDFAQPEIRRLEELRVSAIEARAESSLALGRHGSLISELEPVVARHPTHERLVGHLMLALYRSGRQADALEVYRRTHRHLVAELGLEPGPPLRDLQRAILEQADTVDRPAEAPRLTVADGERRPRAPLPALLEAMARRLFVGRVEERRRLTACWNATSPDGRDVAVLSGEAGIGKTALAAQLAKAVQLDGGCVLYGAAEPQSVVPYHPVVMALREHLVHVAAPWQPHEWPAQVAATLGLTADARRSVPPPAGLEDDERHRLFSGVRCIVERLAEREPLLLVLDDLHWAEPSTWAMVRHLARETDPARVMLLATYRDEDVDDDDLLGERSTSGGARPVLRLRLPGLALEETAELVEARAGRAVDGRVTDRLHERTGGHPFFLLQLLRRSGPDLSGDVAAGDLPAGVRELILRRLRRLGDRAQTVLRAAGILGREFDLALVATLAATTADDCLVALEEAVECGLVVEVAERPDRFAFVHALVRETLYEQQTRSRRTRLHARAAAALERAGAPTGEIAYHCFEARHLIGHGPAVEHGRRAAAAAAKALAFEDEAAHLRRALQALESAPAADEHDRCDLLLRLGEAEVRCGQPTVDATFAEAVESARRRGDVHQLARAAIAGRHVERAVRDDARLALLGEALAALGGEQSRLRVEVLARLAENLHFADRDAEALTASDEALELATRIGDPYALVIALNGRHGALLHVSHVDERVTILARLAQYASQIAATDHVARAHEWSVYARLELGDLPGARDAFRSFAAVAGELRQPRFEHTVLAWRGVFAQLDGRLDEAERLAQEAFRYAGRVQVADAAALLACQLSFIRRDQDRLPELLPSIGAYASTQRDWSWRGGQVIALAAAGETERACATLEEAGVNGFEDVPRDFWWLAVLTLFAEGCAAVGATRHVPALYGLLEPYAERHTQVVFATHLGSVHRPLGLLAATAGQGDAAVEHLEAAWERHCATGAPALIQRSACELARVLLHTGRHGDRRRASALLREATGAATSTLLEPLVRRLAREAAIPPAGHRAVPAAY